MSLRSFTFLLAVLCSFAASAQDKIYKRDGSVIDAGILAVQTKTITYKRAGNASGPEYTILKREVEKIVYQNGTSDVFDRRMGGSYPQTQDGKLEKGGKNILSVIPVAFIADLEGSMSNAGVGIAYERLLDKHGHISLTLPVMLNFVSDRDFSYNQYSYGYGPTTPAISASGYTAFMLAPGVRFYPAPSYRRFRYGLGLSVFTIMGQQPYAVYDPGFIGTAPDRKYALYGFMVSNSIVITVSKHFGMAIDLNGGMPVSDDRRIGRYKNLDVLFSPMVQLAFKVNYKF